MAYASRTLTPVERRYSQTEREALGVYWGITRFHVYLYGMEFDVFTDHKPLVRIFTAAHEAPTRIQKWVLNLQFYKFTVMYQPGHLNDADILSRSPQPSTDNNQETEDYINYIANKAVPKAMTLDEIETASQTDSCLKKVRDCLTRNKWSKQGSMKQYYLVKNELSVKNSIILKGTKLVIPKCLQPRILKLAHESHQGVVKTKQLLREKYGGLELITMSKQ